MIKRDDPQDTVNGTSGTKPLPILRSVLAGFLMGLANLVPGVSGGTMILVMGLYDEFIESIADVTRFRFTKRGVIFLAVVGCAAVVAIGALAGTMSAAVSLHRSAMYSLFIGMTLGGVPLLLRMLKRPTASAGAGAAVGLGLMILIAATRDPSAEGGHKAADVNADPVPTVRSGAEPDPAAHADREHDPLARTALNDEIEPAAETKPAYLRDLAAGALGMSAMVLPGISGAYMFLILDRYVPILAAIESAKHFAMSGGKEAGNLDFLRVLIPVAIGSLLSLVALTNLLKWMLRRHQPMTVGLLLGILLGSVIGIWPFDAASQSSDYALGAALALAGFLATILLSRIRA